MISPVDSVNPQLIAPLCPRLIPSCSNRNWHLLARMISSELSVLASSTTIYSKSSWFWTRIDSSVSSMNPA